MTLARRSGGQPLPEKNSRLKHGAIAGREQGYHWLCLHMMMLVKCIHAPPAARANTASFKQSVKEHQRVDAEAAAKCKKRSKVDVLEVMDIDHVTRCEQCDEQLLPGTVCCSWWKNYPTSSPNPNRQSKKILTKVVFELLYLRVSNWKTGQFRGIKGGGTVEKRTPPT